MKIFKKCLVIILCVVTMFSLCACGKTPAEKTAQNLTKVSTQLQKSIAKIHTTNESELTSLAISPDISEITISTEPAKYYKSTLSSKMRSGGARANLENYILKLEEIYTLNIEILNKNSAINSLRSELDQKFNKIKDECQSIKGGIKKVNSSDEEYINSCVKALRRTAENLDNKKQYFNTAKQKFVSADLNKPETTIIKGNTLLAEMDSVYVDLNFASSILENILSKFNNLSLLE